MWLCDCTANHNTIAKDAQKKSGSFILIVNYSFLRNFKYSEYTIFRLVPFRLRWLCFCTSKIHSFTISLSFYHVLPVIWIHYFHGKYETNCIFILIILYLIDFFSGSYYHSINNYFHPEGSQFSSQVLMRMFMWMQTFHMSKGLQDQVLTLVQKQWVAWIIIYKIAFNRACPGLDLHLKVFCCINCT